MPAIILDSCGLINLYASGRFVSILTSLRNDWYLPAAVEREAQTYRQPDPDDPDRLITVMIDLLQVIDNGFLKRCDCQGEEELSLYLELASRISDDGESMGIALAKCRGWTVLTDDKKARRIARELGVEVIGTPEVMKLWAEATKPDRRELSVILSSIERFSNYQPGKTAPAYDWWIASSERDEEIEM